MVARINIWRLSCLIEKYLITYPNGFSMPVSVVESLLECEFEDNDEEYTAIHLDFRFCGIEFLYMKKTNTCGFIHLRNINRWPLVGSENEPLLIDEGIKQLDQKPIEFDYCIEENGGG